MPDLYEELGVPKDATPEDIKKAYRDKAKKLHPDNQKTGDETAFKKASHAIAILGDPLKREQYDRTGSEDTSDPEAAEDKEALSILSGIFNQLMTMAEFNPAEHCPLKATRKITKQKRAEIEKGLAELELMLAKMRKTVKRLHRKGKEKKAGKLAMVLAGLERTVLQKKMQGEREIRVIDKVLAIVDDHEYTVDEKPKPAAGGIWEDPRMKDALDAMRDRMREKRTAGV